jgi:quinol monooxygenase YgiN
MVQVTVRLTAVSGRSHQLVQALHTLMRETLRRGGCSGAHIAADVDAADAFWYVEDWKDAAALEAQFTTDGFSQLLALIETAAEAPVVEFRVVSATRGLDYVAEVREAADANGSPPRRIQ